MPYGRQLILHPPKGRVQGVLGLQLTACRQKHANKEGNHCYFNDGCDHLAVVAYIALSINEDKNTQSG